MTNSNRKNIYLSLLSLAILFIAWLTLSFIYPPIIIPSPIDTFKYAVSKEANIIWQSDFPVTLVRITCSFLLTFFLGTFIGIITSTTQLKTLTATLLLLTQIIPGVVLGVIILLMFGEGNATPILLSTLLTIPVVTLNVHSSIEKEAKDLTRFVKSCGGKLWPHIVKDVWLPATVPSLKSSLSLSFGLTAKVVILGEYIGSSNGLGLALSSARFNFNTEVVFLILTILAILMTLFQIGIEFLFSTLLGKYYK